MTDLSYARELLADQKRCDEVKAALVAAGFSIPADVIDIAREAPVKAELELIHYAVMNPDGIEVRTQDTFTVKRVKEFIRAALAKSGDVEESTEEQDALRDAFEVILRSNPGAAKIGLAQAQARNYNQKPWRRGFPTRDAVGNQLVFRDASHEHRYCVYFLGSDGSHVRALISARDGSSSEFEVHAARLDAAHALARQYALEKNLGTARPTSGSIPGSAGWVIIRYEGGVR